MVSAPGSFNPRAREGATWAGYADGGHVGSFQSTRP